MSNRRKNVRSQLRWLGGLLLASTLCSSSGGCSSDFDPPSLVNGFRLLAAQADSPFARPGELVTLRPLSITPHGESVEWAYASCTDPDDATFAGCAARLDTPVVRGAGADFVAQVAIPADALERLAPSARTGAMVVVILAACPGHLDIDSSRQDEVTGPMRCLDPSGQPVPRELFVVATKRIFVRAEDRNANPVPSRITWDGAEWPEGMVAQSIACTTSNDDLDKCEAGSKHTIAVETPPGTVETGTDEFGVPFEEQVVIQHFGTGSLFADHIRTAGAPRNTWAARKTASGQIVTLWFVVHDDRGGVGWTSRQVNVGAR